MLCIQSHDPSWCAFSLVNQLKMLTQSTKEVKGVTAGHQYSFKCLVNEGLSKQFPSFFYII